MKEFKLTEKIKQEVSYGQFNGLDDRLKDSIRREGVVDNIFYDDDTMPRVGEFAPRFLSLVIGYLAITNTKFDDKRDYKQAVMDFARLVDINVNHYFDEEKDEYRLTELLYDAATSVYESYWNYDVISKYPEELSILTQSYNNDLNAIVNYKKLDPAVVSALLDPKNALLYEAYTISKTHKDNSLEKKMLDECTIVMHFLKLLKDAFDTMFDFDDVFYNTIKGIDIAKIMERDEVLSLSKALIDIFNGYKTVGRDGVKLPILSLVGPDSYPFTCTPKILTDVQFLTSLMVLKLKQDNYDPEVFNSVFTKEDIEDAERIFDKVVPVRREGYFEDVISDEDGEFDLFNSIANLTYITGFTPTVFLSRYKHARKFAEDSYTYDVLEGLYTTNEEDAEIFYGYVSTVLFNLIHPAFISLLVVSKDDDSYAKFLNIIKSLIEENKKQKEPRDESILEEAYDMLCSDDFMKTVSLLNKLNSLSEEAIETESEDYPDNVIPFDKSKLS